MNRLIVLLFSLLVLAGCGTPGGSHPNKSAQVHTELAGLYYDRAQLGIALEEVEHALQADHDYAPAYYMRGLIHMELREDKDAEEDFQRSIRPVSYTHLRAHETRHDLVCRLLLEKK